jgi:hypothetical protein
MLRVAPYPCVPLAPLRSALANFQEIAQSRWAAWLPKQRLEASAPGDFATVLELLFTFADPAIGNEPMTATWSPVEAAWLRAA